MKIRAKLDLEVQIPAYFFKMNNINKPENLDELTEEQKKLLFKFAFYESSEPAGELYNLDDKRIEIISVK